ncbi:MAG: DUF1848 domain-containing protein, partial [Bacteroidales bacterium]|nr:DUF1848 domain-containing protein [Bacteroidales bacterium]
MIISASRRTDIPAFYGDWFVNRLREGFVLVRNPMNYRQISKIILSKDVVDFIIFWTKNPADFLKNLKLIDQLSYPYYFLFTVNPYGKIFDANLPDLEFIISVFKKLSNQIGDNKVLWRYDPIIITPEFNEQFHFKTFEKICKSLTGYTSKCIISFITMYAKCVKNLKSFKIITPDGEAKIRILKKFYQIASSY